MTTALHSRVDVIEAAGRALIYSVLANGFAQPTSGRLTLLRENLIPASLLLDVGEPLSDLLHDLAASLPTNVDTARDHHMALFPPITSQDAPGYETAYRGDGIFQQTALLADIAGFYRAQGLRAGGDEHERLDHVTVELEFMAVVARKELGALLDNRADDAVTCADMSSLFIRDHLGCWGPAFGRRAAAIAPSPWYRCLGTLLASWVEIDANAAGVVPTDVVEDPLPQDPPDDGMCGPCPVPRAGGSP
ncbi:MAG TPA: molecular chaperone TorD family protein [Acidimicrobiia bacterium]|nr:molecular chaperone TorD family protein [Acidimicrobiia bacterium]